MRTLSIFCCLCLCVCLSAAEGAVITITKVGNQAQLDARVGDQVIATRCWWHAAGPADGSWEGGKIVNGRLVFGGGFELRSGSAGDATPIALIIGPVQFERLASAIGAQPVNVRLRGR
jgi:hypothetical protein